ncbi:MAG: hypothetical protein A2939_00315 [Parcubacteria group bacterium RIFCSPLOWO2_01_FULL_48_18]|nr:MAG: hypothetical protein A2939_00315 [Parcubacteria group bacterium RIFCSPLOWO2_01_FULL_48_18]
MNEIDLLHNLKQLKRITPREEFSRQLRQTIVAPEPTFSPLFRIFSWPVVAPALIAVFALAVVFVQLYTAHQQQSRVLSGLNNEDILSELASSGDINIYLNEIAYYDRADQKISTALAEASGDGID